MKSALLLMSFLLLMTKISSQGICTTYVPKEVVVWKEKVIQEVEHYKDCHRVWGFLWRHCHDKTRTVNKRVRYSERSVVEEAVEYCCSGEDFINGTCDSCPEGFYGRDCSSNCTCPLNAYCDVIDGNCTCKPGWTGANCTEACNSTYYGPDCQRPCDHCSNSTGAVTSAVMNMTSLPTCDSVTGECHCSPGWRGYYCQEECPFLTWGSGCLSTCSCHVNNTLGCHPHNGSCICWPEYTGSNCSDLVDEQLNDQLTDSDRGPDDGVLAAVVLVPLLLLIAVLVVSLLLCHRRRNRSKDATLRYNNQTYDTQPVQEEAVYSEVVKPSEARCTCLFSLLSKLKPKQSTTPADSSRYSELTRTSVVMSELDAAENHYELAPDVQTASHPQLATRPQPSRPVPLPKPKHLNGNVEKNTAENPYEHADSGACAMNASSADLLPGEYSSPRDSEITAASNTYSTPRNTEVASVIDLNRTDVTDLNDSHLPQSSQLPFDVPPDSSVQLDPPIDPSQVFPDNPSTAESPQESETVFNMSVYDAPRSTEGLHLSPAYDHPAVRYPDPLPRERPAEVAGAQASSPRFYSQLDHTGASFVTAPPCSYDVLPAASSNSAYEHVGPY